MQDFQQLRVWHSAHTLALEVYRVTSVFPDREKYGITSQMRRAAASVGANIAEGACRGTRKDFARFLQMSAGSAGEVESFTLLARDLGFLEHNSSDALLEQTRNIKGMLSRLIVRVRQGYLKPGYAKREEQ